MSKYDRFCCLLWVLFDRLKIYRYGIDLHFLFGSLRDRVIGLGFSIYLRNNHEILMGG